VRDQQVEIDLTEEQQIIELGRLAGECLENEAFQAIMEGIGKDLQSGFNNLKPTDKDDFTVLAAQRVLFNRILSHFQAYKEHGKEIQTTAKREAGLV